MSHGYGSVYRRKDGTWVAAVELTKPGETGRRRRAFTGQTREVVEAKLAAYRAENPAPDFYNRASRADRLAAADGHHTMRDFDRLVRERGIACEYCGVETHVMREKARPTDLVRDHRIPLARGGSDDISNISISCRLCNDRKGVKTAEEFLAWLGRDA
jgi:hypothetical protein